MNIYRLSIASIFSVILFMAFQLIDTAGVFERPPFRRRYMEHMDKFHQRQQKKCRDQAMAVARLQVDSVLSGKKILVEVDSFRLLPRPHKPIKPKFDFVIDSIPVDPLFNRIDLLQLERE